MDERRRELESARAAVLAIPYELGTPEAPPAPDTKGPTR
jgi:hypothetical protein